MYIEYIHVVLCIYIYTMSRTIFYGYRPIKRVCQDKGGNLHVDVTNTYSFDIKLFFFF